MKGFLARNLVELILLLLFGGAAIAVFSTEIAAGNATPLDRSLFGALEFFLSVAIGWTSQRIASKEEFGRSLRQYALSAYRRISDTKKSLNRVTLRIDSMRPSYPKTSIHELDLLAALTEDIADNVDSSKVDWADIIGEDLERAGRLQQLEDQLRQVTDRGSARPSATDAQVESLKQEIDKLRSDLPFMLQEATMSPQDSLPREGRFHPVVASYLRTSIDTTSNIILNVYSPGHEGRTPPGPDNPGGPYTITLDQNMFKIYVMLNDASGQFSGEVLNPLEDAGIYRNDFAQTLLTFLPSPSLVIGAHMPTISLHGAAAIGPGQGEGQVLVRVPVPKG